MAWIAHDSGLPVVALTVKELIEELQKEDQDALVSLGHNGGGFTDGVADRTDEVDADGVTHKVVTLSRYP